MALATVLNFAGKNLQGRDFRGQNLTGANFSNSDIRGANFNNAILRNANFQNAKAGIKHDWATFLLIVSFLLSVLSGIFSGFSGTYLITFVFKTAYSINICIFLASFAALTAFFAITIFQGIREALGTVVIISAIAGAFCGIFAGTFPQAVVIPFITGSFLVAITVAFLSGVIACTIAGIIAIYFVATVVTLSVIGVIPGALVVARMAVFMGFFHGDIFSAFVESFIGAISVTILIMLLNGYVGWQAITFNEKYNLIRKIAVALICIRGTSFRNADIRSANFSNATLKNIDIRDVNLIHSNFHYAKQLDYAMFENTILDNLKVRNLLVTKRCAKKSFVGCNFKGANLADADMSYADLSEADISEAIFTRANLEYANLTKAQAIGTNFHQAKLTAACLESWNIDSTTELTGVICDYVYLLNHQQERRPSSGIFAAGEFTKLFQVAINTVDLIFRNGLNLQALSTALTKVHLENEDSLLALKSIENKGDNVVVVRVEVAADVDKAKIHAELTHNYEFALKSLEAKYQAELKSKDEQIVLYRQHQADLKELMQMIAPTAKKTVDTKLVVLKLTQGNLNTGFSVTLQIGLEGEHPYFESNGKLPPASELALTYNQWQAAYRQSLQGSLRIKISETQVTNISRRELFNECDTAATSLKKQVNLWLDSELFRPLKEQLLEKLNPSDSIRVLLQTEDSQLRRIPLHLWNFFERYPKAEIAISSTAYEKREKIKSAKSQVKILAILGDSAGINLQKDRLLLEELPNAKITFLVEPQRQVLNDELWLQPWDILFFAGHSSTQADAEIGNFRINSTDSLTIAELKNALTKAIEQGLHLAIFNSCDGLGLAVNLADLHIPQMIFMREPVPDKVAQEFLKNFLTEFSSGKPLYQSLRSARSKLQGLENEFPYATWLPVICQNPAEIPLVWGMGH
ncbi:rfrA pentapeptide repeat-containing protein [Calothrix sp. NIES-2100]|uniref:pentapeptide repeat-containing protein n=1 Tax=Calothrix sp. NIES-2100 TaxID=1954172 RepID=UPI000B609C27|nr:rfrA pentapeptide repeat-containing protein [Calothrix sp. NIES-2100]